LHPVISGNAFSKKSPAAPPTCPASSITRASGSVTERACYCRLSNEYITLSPTSFTNSAISMSGSIAKRAFFRRIFGIYIRMEHFITLKVGLKKYYLKNPFDIYFRLSGLKELSKR
jgi:hypothetical protein